MKQTIILDIETSGLSADKNAICSISLKVAGQDPIKTWFIKPYGHYIYEKEAMDINKLTMDFLKLYGKYLEEVQEEIIEFLKQHNRPYLLGHNLNFDLQFLKKHMPMIFDHISYHYKDSMIAALFLRDCGLIPEDLSMSLKSLYAYFFKNDDICKNGHTSHYDVIMTEKIYYKMMSLVTKNYNLKNEKETKNGN